MGTNFTGGATIISEEEKQTIKSIEIEIANMSDIQGLIKALEEKVSNLIFTNPTILHQGDI